jgi:type II secretion system protein H
MSSAGPIKTAGPFSKPPDRGFTLLELIVVLVIISLMSALIVPRLTGPLGNLDLKTAAQTMAASLRYARSLAAAEKKTYLALFDLDANRLVILRPDPTTAGLYSGQAAALQQTLATEMTAASDAGGGFKAYRPPEGVRLIAGLSRGGTFESGLFPVFFFSSGASSGGQITLANERGRRYRLAVDFITGMVSLKEVSA